MKSVSRLFATTALLSMAGACAQTALAQESATADGSQEIVVTAAGFEQRIAEAPASISILTREQLETRPFTSLEDAVRNVEGVSVVGDSRSEEHTSELQSLMRISYAVFCLKKKQHSITLHKHRSTN